MQHLHLVGFTAELDGLIFSTRRGSKSGGYVVSLDDRLLDSIREAVRLQTGAEHDLEPEEGAPAPVPIAAVPELRRLGRVHSALAPKDIQARLRAGRSIAEVADEAEVDESWILRFASPVLAEQSRIVERALRLPCRANRKGESAEPLDASVTENLIERGTLLTPDEISSAWSAYHVRDSAWVVRFRYVSRRRQQVAQWAFDLADSTLVPINRLATELGYLEPGRRKRRVLSEVVDDRRQAGSDDGTATMAPTSARPAAKRRAAGRKSGAGPTGATRRPAKATAPPRPANRAVAARAGTGATKRAATAASKRSASGASKRAAPSARATTGTRARTATRAGSGTRAASGTRPATKVAKATRNTTKSATATRTTKAAAAKRTAPKPAKATAVRRAAAGRPLARQTSARVETPAKATASERASAARAGASTAKRAAVKRVAAKRTSGTAARVPLATPGATPAQRPAAKKRVSATPATAPGTPPAASLLVADRPPEPATTPLPNWGLLNGAGAEPVGPARPSDSAAANGPTAVASIPPAPTPAPETETAAPPAEARSRQRPLVAVRATQPPVPLAERVIRIPSGDTLAPDGNRESTGAVVIHAVPAGEGTAPPTLEP